VGSESEEELDDRWLLGWRGSSVSAIDVADHCAIISVGDSSVLTIEFPALLASADVSSGPVVSLTTDGRVQMSPDLHTLVGQRILSSVAFKSGALRLVFDAGQRLTVAAADHYEPWRFTGKSGRRWRSLPGGGLATFGPTDL
jgi:hypothetical protein